MRNPHPATTPARNRFDHQRITNLPSKLQRILLGLDNSFATGRD